MITSPRPLPWVLFLLLGVPNAISKVPCLQQPAADTNVVAAPEADNADATNVLQALWVSHQQRQWASLCELEAVGRSGSARCFEGPVAAAQPVSDDPGSCVVPMSSLATLLVNKLFRWPQPPGKP